MNEKQSDKREFQNMIAKYRNRATIQIICATVLSALCVFAFLKTGHTRKNEDNLKALVIVLYFGSYAMWIISSMTLARAKGHDRDSTGILFAVCYIVGFCLPILQILLPLFIIFGLEDKTKDRMHRR